MKNYFITFDLEIVFLKNYSDTHLIGIKGYPAKYSTIPNYLIKILKISNKTN